MVASRRASFAVLVLALGCVEGDKGGGDDTGGVGGGGADTDADGDGFSAEDDCNDDDGAVNPGATETCNGIDDDCDDEVDEGVEAGTWYADTDGDGFGDPGVSEVACEAPAGFVADATDCDDDDASAAPGRTEVCDGVDNDCDGDVDDADADVDPATLTDWWPDLDGDGYGAGAAVAQCSAPSGHVDNGDDCDDDAPGVSPGADEVCNQLDDDCDALVDDDDDSLDTSTAGTFFADDDGDGFGDDSDVVVACFAPSGVAAIGGDCDDTDAAVNPDATEICGNSTDDDCSGDVDETCPVSSSDAAAILLGEMAGDEAGARLSAGGDYDGDGVTDLAVGAPDGDAGGRDGGQAYVVTGVTSGTASLASAHAVVGGPSDYDHAGCSVWLGGDADGDGYDDLVLGAWGEDGGAVNGGGAFLVPGPTSGTLSTADAAFTVLADDASAELARYESGRLGDVTGDGVADLLVGAPRRDLPGYDYGTAAVFAGPLTGTAAFTGAAVMVVGANLYDYAGVGLGPIEDVTGDGVGDVVVGAPGADAVWVFAGPVSAGTLTDVDASAVLTGRSGDYFGGKVVAGDLDGDGTLDLAVGAKYSDLGATNGGAVFGFLGPMSGTVASTAAALSVEETGSTRYLGSNQAGLDAGDVDGDGVDDLLIGSYFNPEAATKAGAARLFFGPLSGAVRYDRADRTMLGVSANDQLGLGAALGDVDGDGVLDLIAGANLDDTAAADAGAVFVLFGSGL